MIQLSRSDIKPTLPVKKFKVSDLLSDDVSMSLWSTMRFPLYEWVYIVSLVFIADDGKRTEWERQREREEFARTARVFQPMGSSLTSRFTRSQKEVPDEGPMEEEV